MNLTNPKLKPVHGLLFLKDKIRIGSGVDYTAEIENPKNKFTKLMKMLREGASIQELNNQLREQLSEEEILQALTVLNEAGYLEDDAISSPNWLSKNENNKRYETNLNFFSTLEPTKELKTKFDFQSKLRDTRVLIFGMGGIGSNIILSLLELGVGHIIGIDFDRVELKNLNRQVLYTSESVGQLKSDQAKKFARQFNPDVDFRAINKEITSSSDVKKLIEENKPTIIVNVADYPTGYIDFWINKAAVETNVPIFSAIVNKKHGKAYSVIPHKSACYYCQYLQDLENVPGYKEELNIMRTQAGNTNLRFYRSPNGALGMSCLYQGYFISSEIMRYLFWGERKLLTFNRRANIDFLTHNQSFDELKRFENCPICGGA